MDPFTKLLGGLLAVPKTELEAAQKRYDKRKKAKRNGGKK
jgi:hypothetical protein